MNQDNNDTDVQSFIIAKHRAQEMWNDLQAKHKPLVDVTETLYIEWSRSTSALNTLEERKRGLEFLIDSLNRTINTINQNNNKRIKYE